MYKMNKRKNHGGSTCCSLTLLFCVIPFLAVCNGNLVCLDKTVIKNMANQISALSKATGKSAWPPATPSYIIDPKTGEYSLAINPVVEPNRRMMNWKDYWFTRLFHLYCKSVPRGSWLRKVVTMNWAIGWKILFMSEYNYYPPMVDLKDMVRTIRAGRPVPVPPYYNPNIQVVRHPFTCSAKDRNTYDLIVIVNSCVTCGWHRNNARRTYMKKRLWRGLRVGFFFVMGMPARRSKVIVNFYNIRFRQPASLPGRVSQARATRDLLREADRYKDILIGRYSDEYYNINLRFVTGNRWASLYCSQRSPLFLRLDPGYTIVPFHIKLFLKRLPKKSIPNYYAGRVFYRMGVSRSREGRISRNRYAVSYNEIPWKRYPDFASRVALFLGREALNDLTAASLYSRPFRFSDVYIGLTFFRMNRKPKNLRQFFFGINRWHTRRGALGGFTHSISKYVNWNNGRAK